MLHLSSVIAFFKAIALSQPSFAKPKGLEVKKPPTKPPKKWQKLGRN